MRRAAGSAENLFPNSAELLCLMRARACFPRGMLSKAHKCAFQEVTLPTGAHAAPDFLPVSYTCVKQVTAKTGLSSPFTGEYDDPNHPGCKREIKVSSSVIACSVQDATSNSLCEHELSFQSKEYTSVRRSRVLLLG